jgi:hypothetical protein
VKQFLLFCAFVLGAYVLGTYAFFYDSINAQAQQAYLQYEDLLDCVEISTEMDELLTGLEEIQSVQTSNISENVRQELQSTSQGLLAQFNEHVPVFNARCSRAAYEQDELASICDQNQYGASTFCNMMVW